MLSVVELVENTSQKIMDIFGKKSGWFTIDISEYHVSFPREGAFVMMEWINSGEEYYFEKEYPSREIMGNRIL